MPDTTLRLLDIELDRQQAWDKSRGVMPGKTAVSKNVTLQAAGPRRSHCPMSQVWSSSLATRLDSGRCWVYEVDARRFHQQHPRHNATIDMCIIPANTGAQVVPLSLVSVSQACLPVQGNLPQQS